jgi:hypothetical protein
MSAPFTASASLSASALFRRPARPGDARWQDFQPSTSYESEPVSASVSAVIDLALRMGRAYRHREVETLGYEVGAALTDGMIGSQEHEALQAAKGRRHAEITLRGEMHRAHYGAPKQPVYDHAKARLRRGDLISMGLMPRSIRMLLTPGEQAVAAIYAEDYIAKWKTDDAKGFIGVRAGACTRLALRAQRALAVAGAIKITKRTCPGRRGYSTIVEIIDPTWLLWLKNRRAPKARSTDVQKCERPVCDLVPADRKKVASDEELQVRCHSPPRSPPPAARARAA